MTAGSSKPFIVIVDDDPAVCRSIHDRLRSRCVHADAFPSARDFIAAIEAIPAFAPDCVVLNCGLSDLSGPDVLDRLHRSRPDVPVICLSGERLDRVPDVARAGSEAAFDDPLDVELLAETLLEIRDIRSAVRLLKQLPKTRDARTRCNRAGAVQDANEHVRSNSDGRGA
jgi:FixJ family two-component response regulator